MAPQLSSLRTSFRALLITDTEAEKSVIYGRRRTRFIEAEKANFEVGLNCTERRNGQIAQDLFDGEFSPITRLTLPLTVCRPYRDLSVHPNHKSGGNTVQRVG
jgi:hypothetical protein